MGRRYAHVVLRKADIDLNKRAGELTEEEVSKVTCGLLGDVNLHARLVCTTQRPQQRLVLLLGDELKWPTVPTTVSLPHRCSKVCKLQQWGRADAASTVGVEHVVRSVLVCPGGACGDHHAESSPVQDPRLVPQQTEGCQRWEVQPGGWPA